MKIDYAQIRLILAGYSHPATALLEEQEACYVGSRIWGGDKLQSDYDIVVTKKLWKKLNLTMKLVETPEYVDESFRTIGNVKLVIRDFILNIIVVKRSEFKIIKEASEEMQNFKMEAMLRRENRLKYFHIMLDAVRKDRK